MKYSLSELKELFEEYLLTLGDEDSIEWYNTDRGFASEGRFFLEWLEKRRLNEAG